MAEAHSAESKTDGGLAGFLAGGLWPAAVVLGLYFVLSIVVRLILPNGLTLDEAEQSLFSQYWLLGYGPQPPFYNWVQNAFVSLLGMSLLSLALPKFLMLFLCYGFYGMAAREIDRRPAFISLTMLALLLLPQLSYMPQQDLTHTVAVLMAAALFLYALCRTLSRPDWQGYALLGLAIGIGTISKYNFVLLPASAIIAVLCDRGWRARIFNPLVLLTSAIAIAIVLPHGIWLIGHLHVATAGTISKMVDANAPHGLVRIAKALGSLALACLAFGGLAAVVIGLAGRGSIRPALNAGDRWTRLFGIMMLIALLGVVAVILGTGTTKITERWLDPYLLPLPLYLLLKIDRAGVNLERLLSRLVPVFLAIMVISLMPAAAKTWSAGLTGSYGRMNLPFDMAAQRLSAERQPAVIVAHGMHLAGNMRLQFPGVPVIDSEDPVDHPVEQGTVKGPALLVWTISEKDGPEPPADIAAIGQRRGLPPLSSGTLELPYHFARSGPLFKLGYIWLP